MSAHHHGIVGTTLHNPYARVSPAMQFVTKLAVEALDVGVPRGLAGSDHFQIDALGVGPAIQRLLVPLVSANREGRRYYELSPQRLRQRCSQAAPYFRFAAAGLPWHLSAAA